MALIVSNSKMLPWGSDRIVRARLTFGSVTSGSWVTGLGEIDNLTYTNLTANERAVNIDYTTTAGTVVFSALTAGDVVDAVAVGRK